LSVIDFLTFAMFAQSLNVSFSGHECSFPLC
jgi:hypothetical protein